MLRCCSVVPLFAMRSLLRLRLLRWAPEGNLTQEVESEILTFVTQRFLWPNLFWVNAKLLSTEVGKWALGRRIKCWGLSCDGLTSRWRWGEGVEILLVASCYKTRDKLQLDGPLGLYAPTSHFEKPELALVTSSLFIIKCKPLKIPLSSHHF